jgi:hypothetical protein
MWINPQTLAVYKAHHEIRAAFPNVSFPTALTEDDIAFAGLLPVAPAAQPNFDRRVEKVVEAAPIEVDDVWTQQWAVVALTVEEQQAEALQIQNEIVTSTQQRLDDFARTRNYDGILSACTYATSSVPKFQGEGQYCVDARDNTWATLYTILGEVQAGTRPMPSGYADVEPLLPVLTWPDEVTP